jgi:hypothetical protein
MSSITTDLRYCGSQHAKQLASVLTDPLSSQKCPTQLQFSERSLSIRSTREEFQQQILLVQKRNLPVSS